MKGKKVVPALIGGALSAIIVWAVGQWGKVVIPGEIAVAISTLFTAAISLLTPDNIEADE